MWTEGINVDWGSRGSNINPITAARRHKQHIFMINVLKENDPFINMGQINSTEVGILISAPQYCWYYFLNYDPGSGFS